MKLTVPKLEILENGGFSSEVDIFNRKAFGERLANLVEKSNGNIVIALDAKWGEGKSTFIKMWQGHIEHERDAKIKSIYFDAFANDYQKDPFLTLVSEMYVLVKDKSDTQKKEFKRKASDAIKSLARGAVKVAVRAGSGGILDGTILDSSEKDILALLAEQVDGIIADKLEHIAQDKVAIFKFREYLKDLVEKEGCPVVFIIDELDRCRPDFALELVEQIKHLFSVPGITFLLVVNKIQLQESIKARYGNGVEASLYLQKFVNLWLSLPRKTELYQDDGVIYVRHVLGLMLDDGEQVENRNVIETLCEIVKITKPSCREIEQILSYFSLFHNMSGNSVYYNSHQIIIAFMCYLKVSKPELIVKIENETITGKDLMEKAGLSISQSNEASSDELEYLYTIVVFDLGTEEVRTQILIDAGNMLFDRGERRMVHNRMKEVCGWLTEMSIN